MATKITTERKSTGSISFWVKPADLELGVNTREHTAESIAETAASIRDHGQKVPAIVRVLPDGKLQLTAGFGRYEAVKSLGDDAKLWVVVDTSIASEKDAIITRVIENVRKNLTDLEEAKVNRQLIEEHGLTATEVAKLYGRDNTNRVNQLQKLLSLPATIQEAVQGGKVSLSAAVTASGDEAKQEALVAKIEAGQKPTAADVAGAGDADKPAPVVKRSTKHLEEVIAWAEGEGEKPDVDERVIKLLAAVVKFLKGNAKTDGALKNAIRAVDEAIG